MLLKDYYKILEVSPVASLQEIKKAFRKLAHKYHPDKNAGNHLSAAQFREIQEAYEILADPQQREEYNYKRWYNRSIGQSFTQQSLTPRAILEECTRVEAYVNAISIFRVDYNSLSAYIRNILSGAAVNILLEAAQQDINKKIIYTILNAAKPLPSRYLAPVGDILFRLANDDTGMITIINGYIRERKQRETWDKSKWIVVVVTTALLCWLMYLYGQ